MARILSEETSLTRKRNEVLKETSRLGPAVKIEAIAAAIAIVAGGVYYFISGSLAVFGVGIVLGVFSIAHFLKIRENRSEEKRVQAGIKGEARMTGLLAEKLDNQHYVINDFTIKAGRKSAQIDHLVISPSGIFAIETKNWKGHIEGEESDDKWQQVREPGEPPSPVSNPTQQVRRHLDVLREALERERIDWPDVIGMVVFTSPRSSFYVPEGKIPVLKPDEAVDAILRYHGAGSYDDAAISKAVNFFMRNV
ncbi:MAG TPA: nuclease-related domain-containing protein [Kiritimatiellia bacterium]|nr:nuclease-related domain-containing protein [Kiritimatiellia bacterium]